MRLVVDALVAIMLVGILAGIVASNRAQSGQVAHEDFVRQEVHRFQREIALQRALKPAAGLEVNQYPETIDPAWFGDNLPKNPLLPPAHPWVEVAGPSQRLLLDPPDPATADPKVARFWYNPRLGIVRARVPIGMSDDDMLGLYNAINSTGLERLYEDGKAE
jgi:hypothetical protein